MYHHSEVRVVHERVVAEGSKVVDTYSMALVTFLIEDGPSTDKYQEWDFTPISFKPAKFEFHDLFDGPAKDAPSPIEEFLLDSRKEAKMGHQYLKMLLEDALNKPVLKASEIRENAKKLTIEMEEHHNEQRTPG